VIVPAVVVLVGVGVFFLLNARNDTAAGPPQTPPTNVPKFDFRIAKAEAVPTAPGANPKKLQGPADSAAKSIGSTLSNMYRWAFLDPSNRSDGSYDEVWSYFADPIAAKAQQDTATLTLGPNAGDQFSGVDPGKGELQVRVLMDKQGKPATAVALVKFTAHAAGSNDAATTLVSDGQYFLQPASGGWRVIGYKVSRKDHTKSAAGPSSTPSPGATPTDGATP
jgi:hypothetical protein